jgi:cobalt-zinc-cadmium efflux system outer membrane protein
MGNLSRCSGMVCVCVVWLIGSLTPAVALDDPIELANEAVAHSPSLDALRARSRALSEYSKGAGTWKDPALSLEFVNVPVDSLELDESPMSGVQVKAEQSLPALGWSKHSKELAQIQIAISEQKALEATLRLRREVEVTFLQLALSNMLEQLTVKHIERTEELLRAVRGRYEVGATGQHSLLRLMVLRDRLKDEQLDFYRDRKEISAALARALGRESFETFDTPAALMPVSPPENRNRWFEAAQKHRPLLARIDQEIASERKQTQLAGIQARPEVKVWLGYRLRDIDTPTDDGTDFVSAGFSVPIPLGSRKRADAQRSGHRAAEASVQAQYRATRDGIRSDVETISARWERAHEKALTYGDVLIPSSRLALETALSEFSVGKADFTVLYEAEVDLLIMERSFLEASVETHIQRARARATVGVLRLEEI